MASTRPHTARPQARRLLAALLVAFLAALALVGRTPTEAAALEAAQTSNAWAHEYINIGRWAQPARSFLTTDASGTIQRVEWTGSALVVETYDDNYQLTAAQTIAASTYTPSDLPADGTVVWGGFFGGTDANYVVTGQANASEDETLAVVRVTKYSKAWAYQASCEIKAINTVSPFDSGTCEMVEVDGTLYIKTCHKMYASKKDGLNHQASMVFLIDEATMTCTKKMTEVSNVTYSQYGYVSHSFAQQLAALGSTVYSTDHGDSHPRSVVLKQFGTYTSTNIVPIEENTTGHYNDTYTTLGGMATSPTANTILAVGTQRDQSKVYASGATISSYPRNVWLTVTDASDLTSTKQVALTSYAEGSTTEALNPWIVPVGDNEFCVLWGTGTPSTSSPTSDGTVSYAFVDGNGTIIKDTQTFSGQLSDCRPVVHDGTLVWYATNGTDPTFYTIDLATRSMVATGDSSQLADATLSFSGDTAYTGAAIEPTTQVRFGGLVLTEGTDYTLAFSDNVNAGTATVTITGKGSYQGQTVAKHFTIAPRDVSTCWYYSSSGGASYTGAPVTYVWYIATPDAKGYGHEGTDYDITYANNVDAGTASYTVTGKGNFTGTYTGRFTIKPCTLTEDNVTLSDEPYTGSEVTPTVSLTVSGTTTVLDPSEYTISCTDNVSAGTATATITGAGHNVTGSVTKTFTISPIDLSDAVVTVPRVSRTFANSDYEPTPTVTLNGRTLTEGTAYTVSYEDNVNAGTATVTVTGINNCSGTAKGSFVIEPADLSGSSIQVSDQTYTGSALTPAVTVTPFATTLAEGTDYTLSYEDNVNVGTATVTVTGKGNWTGTETATFEVLAASIADAKTSAADQTYTGSPLTPEVTVTLSGRALARGTDYTVGYGGNLDAGTATYSVTGTGNYEGTVTGSFKIAPADLSGASIQAGDQTYTGSALEPDVTVGLGGRTLEQGKDYSVSYADNVDAGTAAVTVTGTGNYTGTASATFKVLPASLSGAAVTADDQAYTGSALEPAVTVTLAGRTLAEGTDYAVSYANNTAVGTAGFTVTGTGNYVGSVSGGFQIGRADVAGATVAVADQLWTGSPLEPPVTVEMGGRTLAEGADYTVSYEDNVAVGTATVVVTGKGNYTGTKSGSFSVLAPDLQGATVTAADQAYTGSPLEPAVTVVLGGATLAEGTDYEVSYADNTNAGTATVTVTGRGAYAGTKSGTFRIAPAGLGGAAVAAPSQTFTGSALTPAVTVTLGGKALVEGSDYAVAYADNTNAGTATVTVTGKGNYQGSATGSFAIAPAGLAGAIIQANDQTYTGSPLTPAVTVTLGGRTLAEGTDYAVAYSDNVEVGAATVTVTGKGNYAGTAAGGFAIEAAARRQRFVDVDESVAHHEDVDWMADMGISTGWDLGGGRREFRPYASIKRADMAAFLHRLAGSPAAPASSAVSFSDVSSRTDHEPDIRWLAATGISKGWAVAGGRYEFRPYEDIRRADMAAFLYRLAGSPDYEAPATSPFADVPTSIAHYKEICWLAEEGVSTGWVHEDGTAEFHPYASIARSDTAAFLHRMSDKGLVASW